MPAPLFTKESSREANERRNAKFSPVPREKQAETLRTKCYTIAQLAYPKLVKALRAHSKEASAEAWTWMRVFGTACDKVLAGSEGQGITITIPSVVLDRLTTMTRPVDTAKGITVTGQTINVTAQLEAPVSKDKLT